MTDKKIILAISSKSKGKGIIRFLQGFVAGNNVRLTLCILDDEPGELMAYEEILDEVSAICFAKNIPLRIRRLGEDAPLTLKSLATYSDLLVLEKGVLQLLALGHEFVQSSCASIAIPEDFESINNVLLISDGSSQSMQGIKQFFQIFSRISGNIDVNLLAVSGENEELTSDQELMLIDYLKQYSKNVGILKTGEPLTGKILKPITYDRRTIVVSTMRFLLSHYGDDEVFKPFFDTQSTLFVPAQIS
jgi:hypothetical protein